MKYDIKFGDILAIDGSFLLHRALKKKALFELKSSTGQRTGGIYQFLRSLLFEFKKNGMSFPVVCWDNGLSKRRVAACGTYKHADERAIEQPPLTPEEAETDYLTQFRQQRAVLIELLDSLGIPSLRINGWEGDDLLYIVSKMSNKCTILTDDRDLLQLVDSKTSVRRPKADELVTADNFEETRGCTISEFVMMKAITGDGSDNIAGCCKGVGEKNAHSLIKLLESSNWDTSILHLPEKELRNYIKSLNDDTVKYRSAFSNFDMDKFLENIELVDLSKADEDVDDFIITAISSTVLNCRSKVDLFKSIKLLGSLEIREVSADDIITNVSLRYKNMVA